MIQAKQELLAALASAIAEVGPGVVLAPAFESPKQAAHGDLACQACPGTLTCQLTIVAGTHAYDPDVHSTEGVLLRRGRGLIGCWSSWAVPALGGE